MHYTFRYLILSAMAGILLSSCASVKPCGEDYTKSQQFFQSKKFKEAKSLMDSLCLTADGLENELEDALKQLSVTEENLEAAKNKGQELAEKLQSEQAKYNQLKEASGAQLAELSADLATKQQELNEKEELLQNREERLHMLEEIIQKQDELMNALSDRIKNALMGFDDDELSVEMRNGKVYVSMSDKLLFRSGSDAVEPKGKEALGKIAEVMMKNTDINVDIEGHTDSIPISTARFKDNWDLSVGRATSVVRILTDKGVDPKRLTASGKGEFYPKATNSTKQGRATNRRTEVVLSPNLNELMEVLGQYAER